MNRSIRVLLTLLIIVSVMVGGNSRKTEDRNTFDPFVMGVVAAPSAWLPISDSVTVRGISIAFDSTVWANGYITRIAALGMIYDPDRQSCTSIIIPSLAVGTSRFAAKNKNVACIGLWTGEILRTSNGGATWDTVYSFGDKTLYINDILALDSTTVIACGDADAGGVLFVKSTDFGLTWERSQNLPAEEATAYKYVQPASSRVAMDVVSSTVWVTSYYGSTIAPRMMRSDDRGVTWTSWAMTLPGGLSNNYYLRSFTFKDTSVGYGIGRRSYGTSTDNDAYMFKTTDGGRTWGDTLSLIPNKPHNTQKILNINILHSTNTMIASGYSTTKAMSFITTDGGTIWSELLYPYTGTFYFSASIDLGNTFGGATKCFLQFSGIFTGIAEPSTQPNEYTLEQNHPNPFNPSTTIAYNLAKASPVRLSVYNALGQVVAVVVDRHEQAGRHTVNFDASNLPSGIYFTRLDAGVFTQVRKMILLR